MNSRQKVPKSVISVRGQPQRENFPHFGRARRITPDWPRPWNRASRQSVMIVDSAYDWHFISEMSSPSNPTCGQIPQSDEMQCSSTVAPAKAQKRSADVIFPTELKPSTKPESRFKEIVYPMKSLKSKVYNWAPKRRKYDFSPGANGRPAGASRVKVCEENDWKYTSGLFAIHGQNQSNFGESNSDHLKTILDKINKDRSINPVSLHILSKQTLEFVLSQMKTCLDDYDVQVIGLEILSSVLSPAGTASVDVCDANEEWLDVALRAGYFYSHCCDVLGLTLRVVLWAIQRITFNQLSVWPKKVVLFVISACKPEINIHQQTVGLAFEALWTLSTCSQTVVSFFVQIGGLRYLYNQALRASGSNCLISYFGRKVLGAFDKTAFKQESFPLLKLIFDILDCLHTFSAVPNELKVCGLCLCRTALDITSKGLFDTDVYVSLIHSLNRFISSDNSVHTVALKQLACQILVDMCGRSLTIVELFVDLGYLDSMLQCLSRKRYSDLGLDLAVSDLIRIVFEQKNKFSLLTKKERLEIRPDGMSTISDTNNIERNVKLLLALHEMATAGLWTAVVQEGCGLETIVKFMRKRFENTEVQESVCYVLEDICKAKGKVLGIVRENVRLVKALCLVLNSSFPPNLREMACRILASITEPVNVRQLSHAEKTYLQQFLFGEGDVDDFKPLPLLNYGYVANYQACNIRSLVGSVVSAMGNLTTIPLQLAGCQVLRNLASSGCVFTVKHIVNAGAIEAIWRTLNRFGLHHDLSETAWNVLYYLCCYTAIVKTIIRKREAMVSVQHNGE